MEKYLISHMGTIVYNMGTEIKHVFLEEVLNIDLCVAIRSNHFQDIILRHNSTPVAYSKEDEHAICNDVFKLHHIGTNLIALSTADKYLSALPAHNFDLVDDLKDWEKFRVISKKDLEILLIVQKNGFLLRKRHYKFTKSYRDHMEFKDKTKDVKKIPYIDLFSSFHDHELSFTFFEHEFPFFAKIYNPCVFYIVFGTKNIIDQFTISVTSLTKIGNYDGNIIIFTDNNPDIIKNVMEAINFNNYSIIEKRAYDRNDMIALRISALAYDIIPKYFQPIFYIDCDVLIVSSINALIKQAIYCEKPSAQIETFQALQNTVAAGSNHTLQHTPSTGSTLFQKSPFPSNPLPGFNSGILMLPSGRKYRHLFHAIYTMANRYTQKYGRDSIPFFDQSLLNYVLHKADCFSPEPISSATKLFPQNKKENTVFIHFWPFGQQRADAMREALTQLQKKNFG